MPFQFEYKFSGGPPTVQSVVSGLTAWKKGDMAIVGVANTALLGATGSATFLGLVLADYSGLSAGTDKIDIITDPDAVYSVNDSSARSIGATLDISGATGAQTVTTSSNKEFIVVATKGSTSERTLVMFNPGKHRFAGSA